MLRCEVRDHVEDRSQHTRILVKVQKNPHWLTGLMRQRSNAALRSPFPRSLCGKKHAVEFSSFPKPPVWMTGLMMTKSTSSSSSRIWHMLRLPRGRKPRTPEVNFFPDWLGHFSTPHPCFHQQAPRDLHTTGLATFFDPSPLLAPASAARDRPACTAHMPLPQHDQTPRRPAENCLPIGCCPVHLLQPLQLRRRQERAWNPHPTLLTFLSVSKPPMQYWITGVIMATK